MSTINITGARKVSKDAILKKLDIEPNSTTTSEKLNKGLKSLFKLGFFDNISIDTNSGPKGLNLTIKVKERPVVSEINFNGNQEVDDEDLEEVLTIKQYEVFDQAKIKESTRALKELYLEKGYLLAEFDYDIEYGHFDDDMKETQVKLTFKIKENNKVKVKRISFIGNKHITDQELKGFMQTQEAGPFSFMSGSGEFRESIADIDKDRLNLYYTTKGFAKAQIRGPEVFISPDKENIYLTYKIEEGAQYKFADFTTDGDTEILNEKLDELKIEKSKGKIYDSMLVRAEIEEIRTVYGDASYAFVNVMPMFSYNENDLTVSVMFKIDKGQKVKFGKFNIYGNEKTRDKVLRRELKVYEGQAFNYTNMTKSKNRIRALGYFDDVVFKEYPEKDASGKATGRMNIDVVVTEKDSTGQLVLTAGYSTYEGFLVMAQTLFNNFMGYGQTLTFRASFSKIAKFYYIGFFDPYFLDSYWSFGLDLYREQRAATSFTTIRTGFDIRVGHALGEYTKFFLTYRLENVETTWASSLNNIFSNDVENGFLSSIKLSVERDRRNDRLDPSAGSFQSISSELAGVWGDKYYIKSELDFRNYWTLMWDSVFKTRIRLGNMFPYTTKPVPYSERFLMGGIFTLRGFNYYSLGPTLTDLNGVSRTVGGLNQFVFNAEWEFFIAKSARLKGVVFFDAGNSFNTFADLGSAMPIRMNWGMGIRWMSPMGALRFEWGIPIARRDGESPLVFQFMIGPSF